MRRYTSSCSATSAFALIPRAPVRRGSARRPRLSGIRLPERGCRTYLSEAISQFRDRAPKAGARDAKRRGCGQVAAPRHATPPVQPPLQPLIHMQPVAPDAADANPQLADSPPETIAYFFTIDASARSPERGIMKIGFVHRVIHKKCGYLRHQSATSPNAAATIPAKDGTGPGPRLPVTELSPCWPSLICCLRNTA
jgi:hypothetical protein